jgi:fibronectin type 3 domain-containing protein
MSRPELSPFSRSALRAALLALVLTGSGAAAAQGGSAQASFDESVERLFAEAEALLADFTAGFDDLRGSAGGTAGNTEALQASYQAFVTAASQQKAAAVAAAEQRHAAEVAAAAARAAQEHAAISARHQQAQAEAVATYQRQVAELRTQPVSSFRRVPGGLAGELQRTQQRLDGEHAAAMAAIDQRTQEAKNASAARWTAELAALELRYASLLREAGQYREEKLSELTGAPASVVPLQLSWTVPTLRVSGEPLTMSELAGYELYYSAADTELTGVITIPMPDQTDYALSGLESGRYFFAISAIDQAGLKSDLSPMVEVVVP